MKILVTGSNGQLGSELKLLAPSCSDDVFIFHDKDSLDITNLNEVNKFFNDVQPNFVINCAAYTAVDKAETDDINAYEINAVAVAILTTACTLHGARLIHISTDYVFSGNKNLPYNESDTPDPKSVYGKSKLAGELEALKNKHSLVIRTSWLYSQFGNNFVKTIVRLASEKSELKVVNDQTGTPTNAADLAQELITIIKHLKINPETSGGIFHYSNDGLCSWYDFANKIVTTLNLSCSVVPIKTSELLLPAPRPIFSVLDKTKIKTIFKVTVPDWEKSLDRFLQTLKITLNSQHQSND